ncbi:GNAT family N-acetyltransferase [uncultured Algibacter sp.]|uniref:GNAT family N-acetyltransferase n=1 Tax=uncultured Algibacter sp. TaxID=298659 RepID=UPI002638221F|nr:GNAT family N-acetyltransferase [uncultured Algibacter sp.]
MKLNFIKTKDFYKELFEKSNIPDGYIAISHKNEKETSIGLSELKKKVFKIYSYQYAPSYLNFELDSSLFIRKIFLKQGYAANLQEVNSIDDYLKNHCKTNFRGNARRSVKKIEACLDIDYKMYFGELSENLYYSLMDDFQRMLIKRFEQRNDRNLVLENWEYYLRNTRDLIINKKASLFVVYNKDKAIAFSLNFHFKSVFYFAIPTFDIDYYKFAPGNVVIYKNLEWCISNGYSFFDMGYGGFENKINWCNTTYNFDHHVLYKKNSLIVNIYSTFLRYKYYLINFILSKNLNNLLKANKKKKKKSFQMPYLFTKIDDSLFLNKDDLMAIDLKKDFRPFLKRPLYDFLYLNNEYIKDVLVYEVINETSVYIIKGLNNQIKIEVNN